MTPLRQRMINDMTLAPDWVCEVLSESTRRHDLHEKRPIYAREGVPYLWLVDPADRTLEAFELHDGQWLLIASAKDDEPVSNCFCANPMDQPSTPPMTTGSGRIGHFLTHLGADSSPALRFTGASAQAEHPRHRCAQMWMRSISSSEISSCRRL